MNFEAAKNQIPNLDELVGGWRFHLMEISSNHYRIEGHDQWGHSVSRSCSEIEIKETLAKCAHDAQEIRTKFRKDNK